MKFKMRMFFLIILVCKGFVLQAQTVVKGFVKDAITKRPMAFVSVVFNNGKGVSTGEDGSYSIETKNTKLNTLIFSYVGYTTIKREVKPTIEQSLDIELEMGSSLKEVVVKRGRGKYRNRNNPAVELIDKVIENKEKNRITSYDYVQYEQYEKLGLSLANKPEKLQKNLVFKNYKFMMENIDTVTMQGRSILPIYLQEKLTQKYLRKNPETSKTYILGEKKVNYGDLFDQQGLTSFLDNLYQDVKYLRQRYCFTQSAVFKPHCKYCPIFLQILYY